MTLDRDFWGERWSAGQIGFHEGAPNDLLVAHVNAIEREGQPLRVLVPLAGKAEDLWWLADRGHEVVGVEFVISAIDQFFASRDVDLHQHAHPIGSLHAFTARGVTMLCDDFFRLTPDELGTFDAIYDRAGLVAIDPSMRTRYVQVCRALARPGARMLLVALAYDQSRAPGPPWSCDAATVEALLPGARPLQTRDVGVAPRLKDAGVPTLQETAYFVELA